MSGREKKMMIHVDRSAAGAEKQNIAEELRLCHLRYFVAAANHGSFRRASAALDIQESMISRAVRYLEDRLGASLSHRHNGGVALTVAGGQLRTGLPT